MEPEVTIQWIDGQPWYVASNGWKHPFVGGGEGEQAPAQVAGGPPAETTTPAEGAGTTHNHEQAPETFDRAYVENLRQEAAGYRTRAKEYDEVFGSYDPDSRAALLDIAKQLSDPTTQPAAAKRLQAIADKIMEAQGQGKVTRPDGEEDPDSKPLTRKEFEELQKERDQAAQEKQAIESLENEARKLGYEPGSDEYFFLLGKAQEPDVAGDLAKAHEKVEQFFADKAAARARQVEEKAGKWPGAPGTAGNSGGAGNEVEPPKNWKEARTRAMATLTRNRLTGG